MTRKDKLFTIYQQSENPVNPDDIAYIMWTKDSVFNFSTYSYAYRQAAEALYSQFKSHSGDYAVKDTMGITLTYVYRHYMELTTKFLYLKFTPYVKGRQLNQEEIAKFINSTGHNLNDIWKELKPVISELSKKLNNTFDVDAFGHYVSEFQRYDESSMKMRYPVDKNGKAFETRSQRIDIRILHDFMMDCMDEVEKLVSQWDDQIYWDDDEEAGDLFIGQYEEAKADVDKFLVIQAEYAAKYKQKHETDGTKLFSMSEIIFERLPEELAVDRFLQGLSDNHLLVIHNLYYIGRNCLHKIMVWKKPTDRMLQFKRSAGAICRGEANKFNTHMNHNDLIDTLMSKLPETVYHNIKECVEMCNEVLDTTKKIGEGKAKLIG